MLRVVANINNRRTLFLGLDRNNTDNLHVDQPIVVDYQALMQTSGGQPVQDIVIFAEETLEQVHQNLLDAGLPLPPYAEHAGLVQSARRSRI